MKTERTGCAGAILAGGQSARMGGGSKALAMLAGQPMIQHVIERLQPQVGNLLISIEAGAGEFDGLPFTLVEDLVPSHRGPLSGLYSALQYMTDRLDATWLLLCPCDAPFVPTDLGPTLLDAAMRGGTPVAVAAYDGQVQPTFSLWHRKTLAEIRISVLEKGHGGLMEMSRRFPRATVQWPETAPPPFFNVNTDDDLSRARAWLGGGDEEA